MEISSTCLNSLDETDLMAQRLASHLQAGDVVFLVGNLGAGKTTFAKYLIRALGFAGVVKSPTYSIVESYPVNAGQVNHFDLYRIEGLTDLDAMGMRDFFNNQDICLIEWPERLEESIKPSWTVRLANNGEDLGSRIIEITQ